MLKCCKFLPSTIKAALWRNRCIIYNHNIHPHSLHSNFLEGFRCINFGTNLAFWMALGAFYNVEKADWLNMGFKKGKDTWKHVYAVVDSHSHAWIANILSFFSAVSPTLFICCFVVKMILLSGGREVEDITIDWTEVQKFKTLQMRKLSFYTCVHLYIDLKK